MDRNRLDLVRAAADWLTLTNSGNHGLTDRRMRETAMFQNAIYMIKPVMPPNSVLVKPTRKNPAPFSMPPPPNTLATGATVSRAGRLCGRRLALAALLPLL